MTEDAEVGSMTAAEDPVQANREVAARMRQHHAAMVTVVRERVAALEQAVGGPQWPAARDDAAAYVRSEIVPHARAEERTIYAEAARHRALAPLIRAMTLEHGAILERLKAIEQEDSGVEALRAGAGLEALFSAHAGIENDVILVELERDPGTDLADVLGRMHASLEAGERASEPDAVPPEAYIDVREIPHGQRRALLLGVVRHLRPGGRPLS
jgi:hypothetical protein